jgi:hypothetical protein
MRLYTLQTLLLAAVLALAALWRVGVAAHVRVDHATDCTRVLAGQGHVSDWEREACR